MDQATLAHQGVLRNFRERGEDPDLDRSVRLRARRHRQEAIRAQGFSVRTPTDSEPHALRTRANRSGTYLHHQRPACARLLQTINFVRVLTGHYWVRARIQELRERPRFRAPLAKTVQRQSPSAFQRSPEGLNTSPTRAFPRDALSRLRAAAIGEVYARRR